MNGKRLSGIGQLRITGDALCVTRCWGWWARWGFWGFRCHLDHLDHLGPSSLTNMFVTLGL